MLLEAFARVREKLPDARLRFVGRPPDGPLAPGVEASARCATSQQHLRDAALLLLPSLQEGFGVVAAEALACGVPVVTTPSGGPEQTLLSSGAGRVLNGFSSEELATVVEELLGDTETLAGDASPRTRVRGARALACASGRPARKGGRGTRRSVTEVAVVVGNWQGEELLPDCLSSLEAQTLRPAEVIVVDGASHDRSRAVAEGHGARVLVRENRGLGHLYNEGARAREAAYVLCANNDVALDRRCLELLAAELDADERAVRGGPAPGRLVGRAARPRASPAHAAGRFCASRCPGFRLELAVPADSVVPTLSANGGAMLVRRELLLELGGFDETMFMDFEDLDLCWRAWLRGRPSVYVPEAFVRHRVGAATSEAAMTRRLVSSHHNLLRFALKCLPARDAGRVLLGELLRLPRHPRLIAPALLAVARELPAILRQRARSARRDVHALGARRDAGGLPPAAGGAPVGAGEERERRLQEDLQVDER